MKIIFETYGSVVLSILGIVLAFTMIVTTADALKNSLGTQISEMEAKASDSWLVVCDSYEEKSKSDSEVEVLNTKIRALEEELNEFRCNH